MQHRTHIYSSYLYNDTERYVLYDVIRLGIDAFFCLVLIFHISCYVSPAIIWCLCRFMVRLQDILNC